MSSASQVRFGPLARGGVLLGLSGPQLAWVAIAVVTVTAAEYTGGLTAVLFSAPLWGLCAAVGVVTVSGRSALMWLPLLMSWAVRRATGRTVSLARPVRAPAVDLVEVPGGSPLRVVESSTGAGYLLDGQAGTLTAVVRVTGPGFALASSDAQNGHVTGWGRVLASLCQQPRVVRVQVLHRVVPAGAASMRAWWATQLPTGSQWSAHVIADLLADVDTHADRVECLLALAVTAPTRRQGQVPADAMVGVDEQVVAFTASLTAADLHPTGALTPAQLRSVLRMTYDPFTSRHYAASDLAAAGAGCVASAGPMGVRETWRSVTTDTAAHAVYWISEWPRTVTHAGFLQPLLHTPGVRRTFTLVAEPLNRGKALRDIRRAKVEQAADAAQRARIGQVEDETTRADGADLLRREQDLVAGHGDLQFTGLITVTTATEADLPAACAATEAAAAQAMCEVRLLVGQQATAHTAACAPIARNPS